MSETRPETNPEKLSPPSTDAAGQDRSSASVETPEGVNASSASPQVTPAQPPDSTTPRTSPSLDPSIREHLEGFNNGMDSEESIDRRLADIEMIGEDVATGWKPQAHPPLSPEVRYLHISRTIHQLVTDRNRSVGIFLAVASILVAAATALLNVKPDVVPIIPLRAIQYWCLPVTFGTLAVLAIFISLLLIRARIGLIYEVAKMNALLGLPSKRVERVNPLSIFYLMHLLVVVLGGASIGFTAAMLGYDWLDDGVVGANLGHDQRVGPPGFEYNLPTPDLLNPSGSTVDVGSILGIGVAVTLLYVIGLLTLYYVTVLRNTTDAKLDAARS